MPRDDEYSRRFSFGPLERRGIAGGLRAGQLGLLALGAVVALLILRVWPTGSGLFIAVLALVTCALVAFLPLRGRSLEEWVPVLVRYSRSPRRYRSAQPSSGYVSTIDGSTLRRAGGLPPQLTSCELWAVPVGDDREVGVFADTADGTLTAVVAVRVRSFGLLSEREQERRLERWGQSLASLARAHGIVRRVQILERTVPADGDALQRYLAESRDRAQSRESFARRSYEALLDRAGLVTQDHELFLAIQVDERRAASRGARGRSPEARTREASATALIREVETFASRFDPADVVVEGVLSPGMLARAIRLAYDPFGRERMNRLAAAEGRDAEADPQSFGPVAADESWDTYRTDGALHRTYWVAQWPRLSVAPTFLAPLLLAADVVRSLSVVLEPVSPDRARRSVEAAITSDIADEELRGQRGFRTTARRRKRSDAALQREEELSSGHQEFRFAAFLTVSGTDAEDLENACDQLEQSAHQAYLDVQPLWGEQAQGFTFGALPVGRGLRPSSLFGGDK